MKVLIPVLLMVMLLSCRKTSSPECAAPAIIPYFPFDNLVWHPDGEILGFNHVPNRGFYPVGTPPCQWYMNSVNFDSLGFYIQHSDGTGVKRITDYKIFGPAWSPDGKWLAFTLGNHIYKMAFNGTTFDTTQLIRLTDEGENYTPHWTPNSDSIYFSCDMAAPPGTLFPSIWKMAADGSGKEIISPPSAMEHGGQSYPFLGKDNRIYMVGYSPGIQGSKIFSMLKDGTDIQQHTFSTELDDFTRPKYFNGILFFVYRSVFSTPTTSYSPKEIAATWEGDYDVSGKGVVAYITNEFGVLDDRWGTIWTVNTDGSNARQLPFNQP